MEPQVTEDARRVREHPHVVLTTSSQYPDDPRWRRSSSIRSPDADHPSDTAERAFVTIVTRRGSRADILLASLVTASEATSLASCR
jgi:hypothetical protein